MVDLFVSISSLHLTSAFEIGSNIFPQQPHALLVALHFIHQPSLVALAISGRAGCHPFSYAPLVTHFTFLPPPPPFLPERLSRAVSDTL